MIVEMRKSHPKSTDYKKPDVISEKQGTFSADDETITEVALRMRRKSTLATEQNEKRNAIDQDDCAGKKVLLGETSDLDLERRTVTEETRKDQYKPRFNRLNPRNWRQKYPKQGKFHQRTVYHRLKPLKALP
ncbi:hypothetical protein ACTXT7_000864 [Hymenolepis weldensis]